MPDMLVILAMLASGFLVGFALPLAAVALVRPIINRRRRLVRRLNGEMRT